MKEENRIEISVIMPVYNTPVDILKEAVDSILNQSFPDFEFIIIDDCSSNEKTKEYLDSIIDQRVIIIRNPENFGITKSLNIGLRNARGKYIARMDSDDISLKNRLEIQLKYMELHPDTIFCGSYVEYFGNRERIMRHNLSDQELYRIRLLFYNAGPMHPSVIYNKQKLIENNLFYDENIRYSQDYMMWANASRKGKGYCLEAVLLRYRSHQKQVSSANASEQRSCHNYVLKNQLSYLFDDVTLKDAENHSDYYFAETITEASGKWFKKLMAANNRKGIYDREKFNTFITDLIVKKVYATYDIKWKDPRSYRILFKYLPTSYVINEVKKRAINKLKRPEKVE